jgi:hypothetical protein
LPQRGHLQASPRSALSVTVGIGWSGILLSFRSALPESVCEIDAGKRVPDTMQFVKVLHCFSRQNTVAQKVAWKQAFNAKRAAGAMPRSRERQR